MHKDQLRDLLAKQTERFQTVYGGEIVRYAEKDPNPKRLLDKKPGIKPKNLKQLEWENYLQQVMNGTYQPDTHYQQRPASKKAIRLDEAWG